MYDVSLRTGSIPKEDTKGQGLQKTNMASIQRPFHFLNARANCNVFFFIIEHRLMLNGFTLLLQRLNIRKDNDAKNPAILSFLFFTKRTQLNAAYA